MTVVGSSYVSKYLQDMNIHNSTSHFTSLPRKETGSFWPFWNSLPFLRGMFTKTLGDHSKMTSSRCFHGFWHYFSFILSFVKQTDSHFIRDKKHTILGFSCVVLSPWPSLPYSPRPHVYSSPLEVMAALWELPQAISRMRLVFNASINLGLSQFLQKMSKEFIVFIMKELHHIFQPS